MGPAKSSTSKAHSDERRDELPTKVLTIIRDLALELHPHWGKTLSVRAESDLDMDLGYDSLARAELLLRLNQEFAVELPDELIVEATLARDICEAVIAASPAGSQKGPGPGTALPALLPESAAPEHAATLLDVLASHVGTHPDRPHVYLWQSEERENVLTYGELDQAARIVAAGLVDRGISPGERVAIMLPTSLAFFHIFFGILYAGAVPVPIYPPLRRAQVEDHLRRQARILNNAGAAALITDEQTQRPGRLLKGLVASLRNICTTAELSASTRQIEIPIPAGAATTALIQYTSGSTGDPKGVVLTHANLLANIRAMGQVMEASSSDVFVSWLPLYHDMGLIGAWLGTLYYGAPTIIMSPLAFIANPARWLRAIHRHRATLSAAPNFAFELCLKRLGTSDLEGLDLSSLRLLVNGAEPVSPSTIRRFTERFAPYGLAAEALAPVYGLAESSVGLAFPPPGRKPIIDRVDRRALSEHGRAQPAGPDDANALEIVACGQPLPGHQIRVVDASGREAPERHEGQIEFKGPSATAGYFANPNKTKALFHGAWLDTGDRGYIAEGDIFLTGRVKDMIIRAGRNIYPQEVEVAIGELEGVRKGCVAAIAGRDEATGTEKLVVVAETRLTERQAREDLERRILEATGALLEAPAEQVVLAPPRAIPKTSSGKIRRAATRDLFERGMLGKPERALWQQISRLALVSAGGRAARFTRAVRAYLYAGWWWTALGLLALAIYPLVLVLPRRKWRHAMVAAGMRSLFWLTGIRFTVEQVSPLPARDVIIVPNHTSYIDGGVITAAIRGPLAFVIAGRFGQHRITGPFLRRLGSVFVGGASPDLQRTPDAVLAALKAGERPVVFPEGRLRRMPGLLSFYSGPFMVAARAGVPVVPVTLSGTRSVLRDGGQWFPRRQSVRVHIGAPIMADGKDFEAALRLSRTVREQILRQCGEPDLGREEIEFGRLRGG